MKGDYITTYSGVHFYPLEPNPDDLRIEDIAHALSFICRGNGQVKEFYSVGEHCINCALEAQRRGYSDRVILACLLHDASESYLSDVPKPFKKYLNDYQRIEEQLLSCIYTKYLGSDLSKEEQEKVHEIDKDLLAHDLFYLLGEGSLADLPLLERSYPYGKTTPASVEKAYLEVFRRMQG